MGDIVRRSRDRFTRRTSIALKRCRPRIPFTETGACPFFMHYSHFQKWRQRRLPGYGTNLTVVWRRADGVDTLAAVIDVVRLVRLIMGATNGVADSTSQGININDVGSAIGPGRSRIGRRR